MSEWGGKFPDEEQLVDELRAQVEERDRIIATLRSYVRQQSQLIDELKSAAYAAHGAWPSGDVITRIVDRLEALLMKYGWLDDAGEPGVLKLLKRIIRQNDALRKLYLLNVFGVKESYGSTEVMLLLDVSRTQVYRLFGAKGRDAIRDGRIPGCALVDYLTHRVTDDATDDPDDDDADGAAVPHDGGWPTGSGGAAAAIA